MRVSAASKPSSSAVVDVVENSGLKPLGLRPSKRSYLRLGEHSGGSPVDAFLENLDFVRLNVGVAFRW
jgi:hypothetical protein